MSSNKHSLVLSSLRDVICSQQDPGTEHEPTPTEYFAILLATINSNTETEHLVEILSILDAVIPQSSVQIVRAHFIQLSSGLIKIAKAAAREESSNSDANKVLRISLTCLGTAMIIQDVSDGFWSALQSLQSINALLAFLDDTRQKLRKVAHNKIIQLMAVHKKSHAKSVRTYIGDFCLGVLNACTRSEYKRSLLLIFFLEMSCSNMLETQAIQLIQASLKLQACAQPVLTAAVFRMIDAFFQSPSLTLNAEQMKTCLEMVLEMRPDIADMESNTYFCTAIASGLVALHKRNTTMSAVLLPTCSITLVDECETEFTQIHTAVASALRRIMRECVDKKLIQDALLAAQSSNSGSSKSNVLIESIAAIEILCQLKYQHTWVYVMDSIRSLFEQLQGGDQPSILLGSIVIKIADLYQAIESGIIQVDTGVQVALGDTLGSALRSCGVINFLKMVPLRAEATPAFIGVDQSREWILNILHTNLKLMSCKLSDFGGTILGIARLCSQAVLAPQKHSLNESQTQILRNRVLQMWSLFPDFCYVGPPDIVTSMQPLAKLLEGALNDSNYPELFPFIISGLTYLAKGARDRCPRNSSGFESSEIVSLKAHAQTFLQLILVFLESIDICDNRFQSVLQCISAWANIASPQLTSSIAKKLIQMLLTSTGSSQEIDSAVASGWIAVVQVIIPFLPDTMVQLLYKTVRPLLTVSVDASLQKRAYSVLDTLLKTHGEVLHETESRSSILAAVSESLLTCQVSARSMRLRCMETLMAPMEEEEIALATSSILGEVLICQKDANKKSRDSALDLLKLMIKKLPAPGLMMQLCSAVVGETAVMRSSAVIGISMLLFEKRSDQVAMQYAVELLPTLCLLLREECTEMSRAIMSYIRVCASVLPIQLLRSVLPGMVAAFTSELGPLKGKFSARSRAIMRKLANRLDVEELQPLVPEADQALLGYILKQARRTARKRDERSKESEKIERMLGSDSDDSDDDDGNAGGNSHSHGNGHGQGGLAALDSRLGRRQKAIFASDADTNIRSLPTSLSDLLEDQTPSYLSAKMGTERGSNGSGNGTNASSKKSKNSNSNIDEDEDEEYQVVVTAEGRVCVKERKTEGPLKGDQEDGNNKGLKRSNDDNDIEKSNMKAGGGNNDGGNSRKRVVREPGEEYRSKKAGGDVWKKGMLEPHAFIPLDARLLSKKHHSEAVMQFGAVVKGKSFHGGGIGRSDHDSSAGGGKSERKGHVIVGNRKQRQSASKHLIEKKEKQKEEHERIIQIEKEKAKYKREKNRF